jgi:hypothetical protein
MTFKELQKLIHHRQSESNLDQIRFFNRLKDKPFWIWNCVEQHKAEDRRTRGDSCFNHIIGLHIGRAIFEELKLRESIIAFITNNLKYFYRFDPSLL